MRARVLAAAIVLAACTGTPAPTSTTATTVGAPATTTTVPDPCPARSCVRLVLDPGAVWSDGTPVTAADFVHTWEMAGGRTSTDPGYDGVTGLVVVAEHELIVEMGSPVPIDRLFDVVLPAHDAEASSTGLSWDGSRLSDEGMAMVVVVQEGVRGVVGALRRGEAEAAWLPDPPAWAVEELAALDGVRLGPGTDWEMVTFNQANPLLAEEWARVAIATALDTEAILDATVRTVDPEAPALSSTMWPDIGTARWKRHDPEAARDILEDNGCEAGDDGIYVCGGVRMSFTWATTSGDAWREATVRLAAEQLGAAGIEILPSLLIPSDLYAAEHLFGDGWDIVSFAWAADDDPRSAVRLFHCDGELNIGRHCDPELDEQLAAAVGAVDPDERARTLAAVDGEVVSSAAVLPLYRRPVAVSGLHPSAFDGPFDAFGELEGEVRLALTAPVGDPAVTGPLDPVTASLRRALYRGAFRARPGGGYAPDLVVDFEVIGR